MRILFTAPDAEIVLRGSAIAEYNHRTLRGVNHSTSANDLNGRDSVWDPVQLTPALSACRHQQGCLLGQMEALGVQLQQEAVLQSLTHVVVKSSEIERETLDVRQVRSSVARGVGLDVGRVVAADRHVEGVVEMMLDATRHYDQVLTADRLCAWHASLFPTGRSGMRRIRVGAWCDDKTGPMQVVSGPIGRERVRYEGPAAGRLAQEMKAFVEWFEGAGADHDPVLKAGLAHLWFVTIHPFDDGNGRIARAIADLALARIPENPQPRGTRWRMCRDRRVA
jgi:Fic family protein